MAYVGTNVGVLAIRDSLKKSGLEPHEPDQDDVDRTTEATAEAIARALGDAAVPWWATLVASWGSLYLSMRMGARPIKVEPAAAPANSNAVKMSEAGPILGSPPPAPVLGQGVPEPAPSAVRRGPSGFVVLPEIQPVNPAPQ